MARGAPARSDAHALADVWWRELLVLLGLTGFAISQPLLSLLGENPTVLTFHGLDRWSLVLFALGLALLPPLVLWAGAMAVTAVDRRVGWGVHLTTVAVLVALTVVQIVKALGLEREAPVVAISLASAVALTWAYHRVAAVATWLQFTAVLPTLAVALFLFSSPSSDLVREGPAAVDARDSDLPPVVMIVLDELPTKSLLAPDGGVDEVRFPNLARFAEDATWYRHHTAVAPSTKYAVPAMLTGRAPLEEPPLWSNYPDNLFTLLAPTHDLVAFETTTKLCGLETCTEGPPGTDGRPLRLGDLVSTTIDLFTERVSPGPDRGSRLDTFAEEVDIEPAPDAGSTATATTAPGGQVSVAGVRNRLERVDRFLDAARPNDDRPGLFFLHLMLPHSPWRFYPSGAAYDAITLPRHYPFTAFNDQGAWVAAATEQRHLLQAQYTDGVVGDLLDELQARGLYDDALVVVVADHGISFELDTPERSLPEDSLDGIDGLAYAPLFIKPPGQTEGSIDDANVMSIDILPTIADILGIDVPFEVEGHVIGSSEIDQRGGAKFFYDLVGPAGVPKTLRGVRDYVDEHLPRAADRWIGPLAPGDDPTLGLYRAFGLERHVGASYSAAVSDAGGVMSLVDPGALAGADGGPPLGLVMGRVDAPGGDGIVVAAVDDRIVAASPLHDFNGEARHFTLLLPPEASATGRVRFALLTEGGGVELAPAP